MRLRPLIVVLAAAPLAAPAVAAADPASLTGEVFSATFVESVGNCTTFPNPVIHFHASGTAAGPYAGTFDETGIAVVDASGTGFNFGPLLDVTTRFTINSAAGRVFGIKQFTSARTPVPQVFGETFSSRLKSAIPASRAGECL